MNEKGGPAHERLPAGPRGPIVWAWLLVVGLLAASLCGAARTTFEILSRSDPLRFSLARLIRTGGAPDDWTLLCKGYVLVREGHAAFAFALGVAVALRPNRATAVLMIYALGVLAENVLNAGVWWSITDNADMSASERMLDIIGLLSAGSVPLAWLWFAGRADTFRRPLRAFMAATLAGAAVQSGIEATTELGGLAMLGRFPWGYVKHRVLAPGLGFAVTGLLVLGLVKRPRGARIYLGILAILVVGGSAFSAVSMWYGGMLFGFFDKAAYLSTPLMYVAVVTAAFILVSREPVYPDDAPRCTACGYNLTGNTSGVCPECGALAAGTAPNRVFDRPSDCA
ncbi:MAG: hypothetical protein FLDDKLPJ_02090 [Phycisphaerae bacterium]|nr:hypothetical protein [Phycisphaerae bacterium]